MNEPRTAKEWQEAVDAAAACRGLADCAMNGLITGGPKIDVARADDLLDRGRKRGVYPSRPMRDLAIHLVAEVNASVEDRKGDRKHG